ncbi:MAG: hypothetical protein ACREHD_19845, partial [Pirellulales bacterium]
VAGAEAGREQRSIPIGSVGQRCPGRFSATGASPRQAWAAKFALRRGFAPATAIAAISIWRTEHW